MPLKVSIITCTLNSSAYLEECLNSIFNQTYLNFEVLIIDGGSTDRTLQIVSSYPGCIIFNDVKGGISNAMNFGISKSSGDIVSILHSDDYYDNDEVLQDVVSSFLRHTRKKWLFGQIKLNINSQIRECPINITYTLPRLHHGNFIPHPSVFVHKSIYHEFGGFNPEFRFAMDYDFLLRISKKYPPIQLDKYLAVFRVHNNSLSSSNKFKAAIESFKIQMPHLRSFPIIIKAYYFFFKSFLKLILNGGN